MRIFYLSRTTLKDAFGGSLMRFHTVNILKKKGYEVIAVTPNYSSSKNSFSLDEIKLKQLMSIKFLLLLERIGLIGDYLVPWAKVSSHHLGKIIKSNDIIISTTGGELGMIYLGNILSKSTKARHIIHMHDPIQFTYFGEHWIGTTLHRDRTLLVEKELAKADKILTTSENVLEHLLLINSNTKFQYMGIPVKYEIKSHSEKKYSSNINIVYAGTIGKYQNIQKFIPRLIVNRNVFFHIIGNDEKTKAKLINILGSINKSYTDRIIFHGKKNKKETDELLFYISDYIFISLDYEFLKYNFPSKIYDCLNLGKPAIYSLPEGSAKKFLEDYAIGIDISSWTTSSTLPNTIDNKYIKMVNITRSIRESFLMENLIVSLLD